MGEIIKFSKNCGTFTIKESGGSESIINGSLNSKRIIIITILLHSEISICSEIATSL